MKSKSPEKSHFKIPPPEKNNPEIILRKLGHRIPIEGLSTREEQLLEFQILIFSDYQKATFIKTFLILIMD